MLPAAARTSADRRSVAWLTVVSAVILKSTPDPIAHIDFVDCIQRRVYEEPSGRQYVVDDDCEPVYSVWYVPPEVLAEMFGDKPVIVDDEK